jgi:hypothetical protein
MLRRCLFAGLGLSVLASPVFAQLPSTISPALFAFPGAHSGPGSAASAGLALADRFLGDEPFCNPATARAATLVLSPALLHVGRQDLRADNRRYDEESAFIDVAGGWFGAKRGALGITVYGYQPVVRLENNTFLRGTALNAPGAEQSTSSMRESRAGVGLSFGLGRVRFGIAPEWTQRNDRYEIHDTGGPAPEVRIASFSGGGWGAQAGARVAFGDTAAGAILLGAAARYVPSLALGGEEQLDLVGGKSTRTIAATRKAAWEGGLALRWSPTVAFHLMASAGGRTAQRYDGFGVSRGAGGDWSVACAFHDARDPWIARVGLGGEQERGVAEPRTSVVGLGAGWILESTVLELGILHRGFERSGHAPSTEERVVIGVTQTF